MGLQRKAVVSSWCKAVSSFGETKMIYGIAIPRTAGSLHWIAMTVNGKPRLNQGGGAGTLKLRITALRLPRTPTFQRTVGSVFMIKVGEFGVICIYAS